MWVLLGVSDKTVEQETFVYFIGIFDNLSMAKQEKEKLVASTNKKSNDFIIKKVTINNSYSYDWSNTEEDEVTS